MKNKNPLATIYFLLCYTPNFLINLNIALGYMVVFWIFLGFTGQLEVVAITYGLAIIIMATLAYNIVYVINDPFDFAKDKRNGTPKNNATWYLGIKNYYVVYAVVLGMGVVVAGRFIDVGPFVLYCLGLSVLSLVHTTVPRLKHLTFYVERLLRIISPALFLYLIFGTAPAAYFLVASLITYPLIMFGQYRGYLTTKLKFSPSKAQSTALVAGSSLVLACVVAALLMPRGAFWQVGSYLMAGLLLAVHYGREAVAKWLGTIFHLGALKSYAADNSNDKDYEGKKQIVVTGLINMGLAVAMGLYAITN